MADLRPLVVPAVLLAVSAGFIVANLDGAEVDPLPTPEPAGTPMPTNTPVSTPTPIASALDLSGTLVWQGVGEDVYELAAVEFPSGRWTQELSVIREPPAPSEISSDGLWRVVLEPCSPGISCATSFVASDGRRTGVDLFGTLGPLAGGGQWGLAVHAYAYTVVDPTGQTLDATSLVLVPDVSAPAPMTVYTSPPGTIIAAFTWHGDEFVVAEDDGTSIRFAVVTLDGTRRALDAVPVAPGSLVSLHTAPGAESVAFSTLGPGGWGLATIDIPSGVVSVHGAVSAGGPTSDCRPRPPSGSPSLLAYPPTWPAPPGTSASPDGSRLTFASGGQVPRAITILDLMTNDTIVGALFPSGSPREIVWSPDGTMIAVATYDEAAERYDKWIVDAATGARRYLVAGCRLVWSPDSRFLAVRGRDQPGIAIIEVTTGARLRLNDDSVSVPIRWVPVD